MYLKNGIAVLRQDPSVVALIMMQATSCISIVPTFGTYAGPDVVRTHRLECGDRQL